MSTARQLADTKQVGAALQVSHGPHRRVGQPTCWGDVARVYAVGEHGFLAKCSCGFCFGGMHTDGYAVPTP